jgi:hypothetical protein
MSGITGIGAGALSGILDSLYATFDTSASGVDSTQDSTSTDTSAETSGSSAATDQAASLALLMAEARLSMMEALFDDSASSETTMNQLFTSAENFKILTRSDILETHPELIDALLDSGTSSSVSSDAEDYISSISSSGSIIDYMA